MLNSKTTGNALPVVFSFVQGASKGRAPPPTPNERFPADAALGCDKCTHFASLNRIRARKTTVLHETVAFDGFFSRFLYLLRCTGALCSSSLQAEKRFC